MGQRERQSKKERKINIKRERERRGKKTIVTMKKRMKSVVKSICEIA